MSYATAPDCASTSFRASPRSRPDDVFDPFQRRQRPATQSPVPHSQTSQTRLKRRSDLKATAVKLERRDEGALLGMRAATVRPPTGSLEVPSDGAVPFLAQMLMSHFTPPTHAPFGPALTDKTNGAALELCVVL